jgi:hypothetical protein
MRIRSVKPEFWRDEKTGIMAPEVALFYLGICSFCDDHGRFEWNPVLVRADLDPYDAKFGGVKGVEKLLAALERLGRIRRYVANGRTYGLMPSFGSHQKPNRPSPSRFPEPPNTLTEGSVSPHGADTAGGGVGEGEGYGGGEVGAEASSASESPSKQTTLKSIESPGPTIATLPCVGNGPNEFAVTQAMVDGWKPAFPAVDIPQQIQRMRVWLDANKSRRKTHTGMERFITQWLGSEQDRGVGTRSAAVGSMPAMPPSAFTGGAGGF